LVVLRPLRPEPRQALGLAEFVSGLVSIADRDLAFQCRLRWFWLARLRERRDVAVVVRVQAAAANVLPRQLPERKIPFGW